MSRQLLELETILQHMVLEHQKLLAHVQKHEAAMKAFDLPGMDAAARLQEAARVRIAGLENHRHLIATQIAGSMRLEGEVTLNRLAELFPPRADALLKLRRELRDAVEAASRRTYVTGRLAGAILGHLNTVVRLVAGAVEKAGLYTKHGIPQVSRRIGVIEAVG